MAPELLNGSSNKVSEKVNFQTIFRNLESLLVTGNMKIASKLICIFIQNHIEIVTNKVVVQLAPPYEDFFILFQFVSQI